MNNKNLCKYKKYKTNTYNIGGPGEFEIAEFIAEKMSLKKGKKLIDIGCCQGFQTCFLAKEYGVNVVGIDPGGVLGEIPYGIETLMAYARVLGIEDNIVGIKTSLPESLLPSNCFDYAYSTNCLEMIRGNSGTDGYLAALSEIYRILKNGGLFGLAEPMCKDLKILDMPISEYIMEPYKEYGFDKCFVTIEETVKAVGEAGFKILDYGYNEESYRWWQDHVSSLDADDICRKNIELMNDSGWLSFGYIISIKDIN